MANSSPKTLNFSDTSIAFASKSGTELNRAWWLFKAMNSRFLVQFGSPLLAAALRWGLPVKGLIKSTIFKQFCGGETIEECTKTVAELGRWNVGTILDFSAEGEKTEKGFDAAAAEIMATVEKAAVTEHIPFTVFKFTGLARFTLLEKIQSGQTLTAEETAEFARAESRMERICTRAAQLNVRILIDGEETWIQDVIDRLCYRMMQNCNKQTCIVYNTYQLYRKAALPNLKKAFADASANGYFLGAKPVRGAYMEKERTRAGRLNYPDPIQNTKADSDADYNAALLFCLDNIERISLVAGTHNEESSYLLAAEMKKRNIAPSDTRIYFSQLLGMSDNISFSLAKAGYNVAKYVPYGPVGLVMPYLMRRASENTSISGQSSREFNLIDREKKRRAGVKS